jgi:hypothetical protein
MNRMQDGLPENSRHLDTTPDGLKIYFADRAYGHGLASETVPATSRDFYVEVPFTKTDPKTKEVQSLNAVFYAGSSCTENRTGESLGYTKRDPHTGNQTVEIEGSDQKKVNVRTAMHLVLSHI